LTEGHSITLRQAAAAVKAGSGTILITIDEAASACLQTRFMTIAAFFAGANSGSCWQ
jgi:hypothetical protein